MVTPFPHEAITAYLAKGKGPIVVGVDVCCRYPKILISLTIPCFSSVLHDAPTKFLEFFFIFVSFSPFLVKTSDWLFFAYAILCVLK